MGKYERLEEAPCQQFSFIASSLFKNLEARSKDIVWRRFHSWVKYARQKANWHNMGTPDFEDLSEAEEEALSAMAEGARNGFRSLWEETERNARNRRSVDNGSTAVDGGRTDRRQMERKERNGLKRPTEYKRRVVTAADYEQRPYDEKQLEDQLGVNEIFKAKKAEGDS